MTGKKSKTTKTMTGKKKNNRAFQNYLKHNNLKNFFEKFNIF